MSDEHEPAFTIACLRAEVERQRHEMAALVRDERERAALIVERWSLPTIQTPSMWLIDKAGITSAIRDEQP